MTPERAPQRPEATPAARDEVLPARTLERDIGRPPTTWTVADLVDVFRDRRLRLVHLLHVGGDGWVKTLDFVPRSVDHLRDVLEGGERADGSSLFPGTGVRAAASDVLLRPRVPSAFLDPFAPDTGLALLCGHADRHGRPLAVSPDTIVRAAHARVAAETGIDLHALAEVEFFLGRPAAEGDDWGDDDRGYHASSPFVFGERLRRRALLLLAEMGVPVKYGHSEVGYVRPTRAQPWVWEQHEVEMALAPLPDAADHVVLAQWVLRNLAREEGLHVRFDPVLRRGHAGSGLHVHLAPMRDGRSRATTDGGRLTEEGRWLVGGLVRHGVALMSMGNRAETSFVRLRQGKESPSAVAWGDADRSALVRLPVAARTPDGREVSPPTIEFRLPDGSAHPHLLLAGVAQVLLAGRAEPDLDGVLAATASARVREDPAGATRLPRTRAEAAAATWARRSLLEAGGVFPSAWLDRLVEPSAPPPATGASGRARAGRSPRRGTGRRGTAR